ncbi:hypothetical protein [Thalassospira aquimaris]|uniref:SsDNA binding protein n=1 Tax=Thalassospira aquimaris TaxID=3037796 RepID=A0ABT6GIH4_9PROT|nr:hypothetical protein [Thalassospira sp. FZY0004]MDG4721845.1 hypothetical protein [Thalassospira sp. FZY0004]
MNNVVTSTDMQRQAQSGASQATRIEQSRAIAEVQGAIVVAQQRPRDITKAIASMTDSCRIQSLAEKAFFRFNRGGGTVSGPSIHLARELARCWGNIDYGIKELSRDDLAGVSEMQAFAWDLETNNRAETTFIVPHGRDTRQGVKKLTDLRDIYENNANAGARRLREMILGILPPWFVDDAKDLCTKTLTDGGGIPLPKRIAGAVERYAELGVDAKRLGAKVGRPSGEWNAHDIAQLQVIYRSIQNGEVQIDDEFPVDEENHVTGADLKSQANTGKKIEQKRDQAKSKAKKEPEQDQAEDTEDTAEHDPETGEVINDDEPADDTVPEIPVYDPEQTGAWLIDAQNAIKACNSLGALKAVWTGLAPTVKELGEDSRVKGLIKAKEDRKAELSKDAGNAS